MRVRAHIKQVTYESHDPRSQHQSVDSVVIIVLVNNTEDVVTFAARE